MINLCVFMIILIQIAEQKVYLQESINLIHNPT
jgi:hypothetical protein